MLQCVGAAPSRAISASSMTLAAATTSTGNTATLFAAFSPRHGLGLCGSNPSSANFTELIGSMNRPSPLPLSPPTRRSSRLRPVASAPTNSPLRRRLRPSHVSHRIATEGRANGGGAHHSLVPPRPRAGPVILIVLCQQQQQQPRELEQARARSVPDAARAGPAVRQRSRAAGSHDGPVFSVRAKTGDIGPPRYRDGPGGVINRRAVGADELYQQRA
ncbi:uncharacterized protein A4U43_C08F11590 [Asparagus officinalis]|nr:uncharacterized protein A4U43_C08F11590 [Asparagus officinalis]